MTRFRTKLEAQTKQIIGQMLGDQQLVQEGLAQQREAASEPNDGPEARPESAAGGSSAAQERQMSLGAGGQSERRISMKVSDVMTSDVQLCTPEDTVGDVAQAMARLDVGLLPVAEGDYLVGMITDRDLAIRVLGKGRGPDTQIKAVMTPDVKYCFEDQDLETVSWNMGDIQVRRLPVLNRQKRLVGILSLGDIARSHERDATAASLQQISRPGGQHTQAAQTA
ncbi:CBS domain-containing protein [Bradyrhizobium sp. LM2.7]